MPRVVSVAVPVPQLDLLTYTVPDGLDLPPVGARVLVPVASRVMTGCVVSAEPSLPPDARPVGAALREVTDVLDEDAYLPETVLRLCLWVAEYYACSPGEVVAAAMPPLAMVESRRVVELTDAGRARLAGGDAAGLTPLQWQALVTLGAGRPTPVASLRAKIARAAARTDSVPVSAVVRALERLGLVLSAQVLDGARRGVKLERVVRLTAQGHDLAARLDRPDMSSRLGARQQALVRALAGAPAGLSTADLRARGLPVDGLRRLEMRQYVTLEQRPVERDPFAGPWGRDTEAGNGGPAAPALTDEQQAMLERLSSLRASEDRRVVLVHGVTGSGKTEIYLQLARQVVDAGQDVLVLVPEIALTPAVATAFRARFGDRVALQHSGLSDGERHDQWQRIRRGDVRVVVGTRSAVFAPLARVGLVVVDEEHDGAYKQDEAPRYNGRDVAIVRGTQAGALVVLGSATPSMESYAHATRGRYTLLELERRVLGRSLAQVRTVNMREEYAKAGPDIVLSELLREQIARRLERREQVLLLLNRRGFSTAVFCRQCGGTVECPNCSVSLVVYGRGSAVCHYCNYSRRVPRTCPSCGAPYLELMGFGTERVEREVGDAFPSARVARLDRDAVRRRGALPDLLAAFRDGRIDVLVGTQMIAKGHDFPRVTLVGVISADVGLGLADFRASERTFQLLTQVVGRAGRGDVPGEAVIQTLYPDHYSIRHACQQDYRAFFAEEIRYRTAMRYPPAVALINGLVRGPSYSAAIDAAGDLVARIVRHAPRPGAFTVLGPAPAPLARLKGEHRAQFFVKGVPRARAAMRQAVQAAVRERPDLRRRLVIDVDPLSVL